MITKDYMVLQPCYGRDYKTKSEVEAGFRSGEDWMGDYTIKFAVCSIRDFAKGVKVELRYGRLSKAVIVTV